MYLFTAECYSGDGAYKTYKNDGPTKQCYTSKYQPCNFECESVPCAGSIHTIFVYKLGTRTFVLLPCPYNSLLVSQKLLYPLRAGLKMKQYQLTALKHTYQLHGIDITLRMRTTISPGQWQPWTAVSPLLGLISMA